MALLQAQSIRWKYAAAIALLALVCTKMLWGMQQYVDVVGGDDAMYINLGRSLPGKLMPDFAPIYVVWLKLLRVITGDPILAYYINIGCMVLSPAIAFLFFLRGAGLAWWAAMLFPVLLMSSEVVTHLGWNPHIGHLAAGLLLFWLAWVVKETYPPVIVFSGALAALVISYVRPEFFLAYMALSGLGLLMLLWFKWQGGLIWSIRLKRLLLTYVILSAVLVLAIGIPLGQDAWRSWVAIFQHVVYNYALRNDLPYPFMESFNMTEYWKMFAGESTDVKEILQRNMPEIKAHLAYNFTAYWKLVYVSIAEVLVPRKMFSGIQLWGQWVAIMGVLYVVYSGTRLQRAKGDTVRARLHQHGWLLFTTLVICGPGIFFSFLIFPRDHYFMAHLPLYLMFLFLVLLPIGSFRRERKGRLVIITGLLLLLLVPTITKFEYEKIWGSYDKVTLVHDIRALQALPVYEEKVRLMERETNLAAFLKGNCPVWFPYKEQPFDVFIDSNEVDIILVSEAMRIDRIYRDDTAFHAFVRGGYREYWERIPVEASGDEIYLRKK
jgi:hypothetical protein